MYLRQGMKSKSTDTIPPKFNIKDFSHRKLCLFPHKLFLKDDDDFFIFILLSQESDGGAIHGTNLDSLRSRFCFQSSFASDFFNLTLVRFQHA